MYLCAQRVHAVAGQSAGMQGINAFLFLHGGYEWTGGLPPEFRPEVNPGVFSDQLIQLAPPGNRVRSYLDIVAPDHTPINQVISVASRPGYVATLPTEWSSGSVWCRFGAEEALAPQWNHELGRLLARIVLLWKRQEPA